MQTFSGSNMQTFSGSRIVSLSLYIILIASFSSTATSSANDHRKYAWRLIERKIGDWKLVALPRVNRDNTASHDKQIDPSNRRSLRHGPSFVKNPSPHPAQESHGGEIGGGDGGGV